MNYAINPKQYENLLKRLDWLARKARNTQGLGLTLEEKIERQETAKRIDEARRILRLIVYNVETILARDP